METWYKVSRYSEKIEQVEIMSSTDKTLCIKREGGSDWYPEIRRVKKITEFDSYFKTRQEAFEHKLAILEYDVNTAKRRLSNANSKRETFLRNEGSNDAT